MASRPEGNTMSTTTIPPSNKKTPPKVVPYRRPEPGTQPESNYAGYRATARRAPSKPLVYLPHTLSEVTGPVFGHEKLAETDNDLTRQHSGDPLGERIIVTGRVLDGDGRPVSNSLIEIWQANAAGRQFLRRRPNAHRPERWLRLRNNQARRVSLAQSRERLASRSHSLLALR